MRIAPAPAAGQRADELRQRPAGSRRQKQHQERRQQSGHVVGEQADARAGGGSDDGVQRRGRVVDVLLVADAFPAAIADRRLHGAADAHRPPAAVAAQAGGTVGMHRAVQGLAFAGGHGDRGCIGWRCIGHDLAPGHWRSGGRAALPRLKASTSPPNSRHSPLKPAWRGRWREGWRGSRRSSRER